VRSGAEALVGEQAVALQDFKGAAGQVRAAGAIWAAELEGAGPEPAAVRKGDKLTVRAVDGLTLKVTAQAAVHPVS
jgi:membrane protein implicated in regulation of membrane protease activity